MSSIVDIQQKQQQEEGSLAGIAEMRTRFEGRDGYGMEMNDATYRRYLVARKLDVEKAVEMLENTLKWRCEQGLADMQTNWMESLHKEHETGKMYVRGYDKEGHVIIHMQPGHENTREHEGNIRNLIFNLEKCVACLLKDGRKEKWLLIIDFEGYSMFNAPPMKTSMETLSILQSHYPERLLRACLVNPPWLFMTFWNVIYPLVDPVTQQKLEFVKETGSGLKGRFEQLVELDSLETRLGGNNTVPFDHRHYLQSAFALDFNAQQIMEAQVEVPVPVPVGTDCPVSVSAATLAPGTPGTEK